MTAARALREGLLTGGALLGVLCLLATAAGMAFGVVPLVFRSGSMSPTIATGDLAIARTVDASAIRPGDIVSVVTGSGARVTHRVVASTPQGDRQRLTLKGDANQTADAEPYVIARAERVLFHVPKAGYVIDAAISPIGIFVGGLYVAVLLRVLFRRRPPDDEDGAKRGGRRRAASTSGRAPLLRRSAIGTAVLVLSCGGPAQAVPWTDAAPVTGGTFTARTIPAPVAACGLISVGSVQVSWAAVSGATGYVLHSGANGATTETVGPTVLSKSLSGLISGGRFWVEAQTNYGSVTWTSLPSNSLTYTNLLFLVGLCS